MTHVQNCPQDKVILARAREECCHRIVDQIREIAKGRGDSCGDVGRDRLIIEVNMRLLGTWSATA